MVILADTSESPHNGREGTRWQGGGETSVGSSSRPTPPSTTTSVSRRSTTPDRSSSTRCTRSIAPDGRVPPQIVQAVEARRGEQHRGGGEEGEQGDLEAGVGGLPGEAVFEGGGVVVGELGGDGHHLPMEGGHEGGGGDAGLGADEEVDGQRQAEGELEEGHVD